MAKSVITIILLFVLKLSLKADSIPTVLYGNHKEYAGQVIKVYKYDDFITRTKSVIATDTVDNNGDFNLSFIQNETQLINVPLGIYSCILFTEKGKKYNVILPPYQPKTKADIFNPFFNPVEMYLGTKNPDSTDINYKIAVFNEKYSNFVDSNYFYIFQHPNKYFVDSVILSIDSIFKKDSNQFFYNYRNYKYAWLKYVSYMRDYRYIIREYFNDKPILYQNPAYMDLFNQLFTNFLTFYMNSPDGERLYSDIAYAKSPTYVKETFSNNLVLLNDTLQEFVLLKGLNDAMYKHDFPFNSLLITLDSVELQTKVEQHKTTANNIRTKALKAKVGYPAPKFKLQDADSVYRSNNDYLANFVYLNFISIETFPCRQDLELLKQLYEKHKTDFKIISICIDDDFQKAVDYFKAHNYDWILLSYKAQKNITDDYKVRVYPSYYLINPEGKLSMSPAPSPGENFEWQFFKMLQSLKRQQHD